MNCNMSTAAKYLKNCVNQLYVKMHAMINISSPEYFHHWHHHGYHKRQYHQIIMIIFMMVIIIINRIRNDIFINIKMKNNKRNSIIPRSSLPTPSESVLLSLKQYQHHHHVLIMRCTLDNLLQFDINEL